MKVTEILREEHEKMLAKLEEATLLLDQCIMENLTKWEDFLCFQNEFSDNIHHAKEEGVYFEWMRERDGSLDEGPLSNMLRDHQASRFMVSAMNVILKESKNLGRISARNTKSFVEQFKDYSKFLNEHIRHENNVLFEIAEKLDKEHKDGDKVMLPKFEQYK
jgi:hemerythrin-like domain-containing protein